MFLDDLKVKVESLERNAVKDVHIIFLRETVAAELSRLMTLDPNNATKYQQALKDLD